MSNWKTLLTMGFIMTSMTAIAPGDTAPDFKALNQDGKTVQLSALKGKPVLVYFYPKDDTPGCTKEACSFRDAYATFQALGLVILGVSAQDQASHQKFRAKYKLPFDLLTDADGALAEKFGVSRIPLLGLHKRQSVLISAEGKILKVYADVDPATHSDQVLNDLKGK